MGKYLGDILAAQTLNTKFSTNSTSAVPTTLAGSPVISVYKNNSTTQSTAGVTLSVDFDSVTGMNNVAVDTSADGTFYAAGNDFQIVITTGTVGGVSVVGAVVGEFSIQNRTQYADVRKWLGTAVTAATAGIPDVNTKNINNVAAATPGASGGILIAGSNAATTFNGLTTGALACTTITASGAVAFQGTFAVTTSTSLAAFSCTTLTASGAVAFQSTFATTGTTTFNAFTITNALTVSGATTFTGAITGTSSSNDLRINGVVPGVANGILIAGSNAATTFATGSHFIGTVDTVTTTTTATNLTNAATSGDFTATMKSSLNAATPVATLANGSIATATFAAGATIPRVTLADTVTTYTGNTPQTGDAYSIANNGTYGNSALHANITTLGTAALFTAANGTTLQTSVNNLNNLSALANLYGPTAMEIPASGSIAYSCQMTVKDTEGHQIDLTASPTVTAANTAGTDRSANLSSVTHVATGQYSWTYTVTSAAAQEGLVITATGTTVAPDSSSRIAILSAAVVSIDTAAALAAIEAQTNKIGTNAADSPNTITAQGTIATNLDGTVSSRASQTSVSNIASGTTVVRANDASGGALFTATNGATMKTELDAVKAKTDNLPASPAATGAKMDLVDAPNAVALAAIAAETDTVLSGTHGSGAWGSSASTGYSGTAQAGSANTITLASSASASDNKYDGLQLTINFGLATQETNVVASYVGATKIATMQNLWKSTVSSSTTYVFLGQLEPATSITVEEIVVE